MRSKLLSAAVGSTAVAAVAVTGISPSVAAPPNPQQIGVPSANPSWQPIPTQSSDCQLADSCGLWAWIRPGQGFLIEQSGFVKSPLAAKYRMKHAADTYQVALTNGTTSKQKLKIRYTKKNRQHKMKLKIHRAYAPGTQVTSELSAFFVVAQDQVRKRPGNSAPFKKRIGIGTLAIMLNTDSIPNKVTGKNNKKLRKSMYKIIKGGASHHLEGQVKT